MEEVFKKYESEVRSYCRSFPKEFNYAKGSIMKDTDGKEYIDFFCGAGALNYGHNNDYIKSKIIEYLNKDGIVHSLDMYTTAKKEFIEYFEKKLLEPKGYNYKIQFTGPTGTNSVEAALKLARKVKKRNNILALMGGFHGMSLGSLALTTDILSRKGAGVSLNNVTHIPTPYMFPDVDMINYLDIILSDDHSGIDKPAAIIIETTQAEGGLYVLSNEYLKGLRNICDKFDMLLIVDDIQVGCGRSGNYFSFERADIIPDIVCLSKSLGGYGLPFAVTLLKPELDIWAPGEHNGTFRGNQLAMVGAKAGLELVTNDNIQDRVANLSNKIEEKLKTFLANYPRFDLRGIGFIWGIDVKDEQLASNISRECFNQGLVIEKAGRNNSVIKLMPSLLIEEELLDKGINILITVIKELNLINNKVNKDKKR